ncbi:hypothetical protein EYF80_043527 [Liparis tanakae]|uniref:Uncharacterized protein n=1 Tax=Liparis tanakae TaxID=230148 RepID=A0A4Z2FYH3_9TELE|nr:hypothetical protein EYF80_043527 [Liparis tanakae]
MASTSVLHSAKSKRYFLSINGDANIFIHEENSVVEKPYFQRERKKTAALISGSNFPKHASLKTVEVTRRN